MVHASPESWTLHDLTRISGETCSRAGFGLYRELMVVRHFISSDSHFTICSKSFNAPPRPDVIKPTRSHRAN